MKKSLFACLLVALLSFSGSKIFAQKNVVKINPLSLFLLTGSGAYERAITPNMSVQLGGYYTGLTLNGDWLEGNEIAYKVWAITPELRFYPLARKDAPRGIFIGPFARYRKANASGMLNFTAPDGSEITEQGTVNINSFGGGAVIGYQAIILKHISLETFIGPGLYVNTVNAATSGPITDNLESVSSSLTSLIPNYNGPNLGGVGMRAGVTIGVAF